MSSKKVGGKQVAPGTYNASPKSKNASDVPIVGGVEQLNQGLADISLDSVQDGGWEQVHSKKSKNRAGSSAAKTWVSQNSGTKAWGQSDTAQKLGLHSNDGSGKAFANSWAAQPADSRKLPGRGNVRPQSSTKGLEGCYMGPGPIIPPPLEHGWKWNDRPGGIRSGDVQGKDDNKFNPNSADVEGDKEVDIDDDDDDVDVADDSDDDLLSDDFDSDTSQKSHETRKKSRWFKAFFNILDSLTIEEISEPARQWHCPACQGGPGAIDWYRGLQPLITHAKTKGSKRVKLHRELAELLDEELYRRGTSAVPAGEAFGKWKGLYESVKDHEIVWPPMVIIMNTRLEQDADDKWIGMGNQELLDYFSSYAAVKARHSYGPQGHRGMSVLISESSAIGYLEAERLHKHFAGQGTDREAWDRSRIPLFPGGKRQLYGYMATKKDVILFNQHSQGKSRLKFEMRSYQEMVVSQMKQMSMDNQLLIWFKNRVAKEKRKSKAYKESLGIVSERLRKTIKENRIVKERTKVQHQESKEEMDYQDNFFKEQIKLIHGARDAKEDNFEKFQQDKREKVRPSGHPSAREDPRQRAEEVARFIKFQDKEMENFVKGREEVIRGHEEKVLAMKQRHWEEEVAIEKEFDDELSRLMDTHRNAVKLIMLSMEVVLS